MEIVVGAAVAAVVSATVVLLLGRQRGGQTAPAGPPPVSGGSGTAAPTLPKRPGPATRRQPSGDGAAGDGHADEAGLPDAVRAEIDAELRERRAEIARIEERLLRKEEALAVRLGEIERRETSFEDRQRNLDNELRKLKTAKQEHLRELERIASLSAGQARQILLRELEEELRHDSAALVRQVEEEARRDAERKARSILATVMQRVAGGHASETTVSTIPLESDDLKGRIIGREGRNIRALETLTGIDFIIDDTPGAVVLSGFDGVRREIARVTLEKLLQDGRIHPARIEEMYFQSKAELEEHMVEAGEAAALEANVHAVDPELSRLLGRLQFRTSYGQNVLGNVVEVAQHTGLMTVEQVTSTTTARSATLL